MDERTELSRWIAGRRAAEERERDEVRDRPISPTGAFMAVRALIAFSAALHGWPLQAGPDDESESLAFHVLWARLRRKASTLGAS